uniref:Acyltransferase C-terminal domain-containing protein n=1 Tax=Ciona savignyi TaxID=51511 RepID=H2YZH5_CIOSA
MENGLTPLKHHLVPRTKGFVLMTQGLRETVPAVYDATLCFRNRQDPKLVDYVSGNSYHADLVIRRIPMELVPGSEVDCSEFIHQIFKEKDDLVDYHLKNNCFPCQGPLLRDYVTKKIPKDKSALYIGFIWSTVQLGVLFYFLLVGLVTGTWIQITFTVLIIGAIFGMTNLILDSGTAKSSYGAESRKNK